MEKSSLGGGERYGNMTILKCTKRVEIHILPPLFLKHKLVNSRFNISEFILFVKYFYNSKFKSTSSLQRDNLNFIK